MEKIERHKMNLAPPAKRHKYLLVQQELELVPHTCLGANAIRFRHWINLHNSQWYAKWKFTFSYAIDSVAIRACIADEASACAARELGSEISATTLTATGVVPYWAGLQKGFPRAFCWLPTPEEREINIVIEFSAENDQEATDHCAVTDRFIAYLGAQP